MGRSQFLGEVATNYLPRLLTFEQPATTTKGPERGSYLWAPASATLGMPHSHVAFTVGLSPLSWYSQLSGSVENRTNGNLLGRSQFLGEVATNYLPRLLTFEQTNPNTSNHNQGSRAGQLSMGSSIGNPGHATLPGSFYRGVEPSQLVFPIVLVPRLYSLHATVPTGRTRGQHLANRFEA